MTHDVGTVIAALRGEHDALVSLVGHINEKDLRRRSYVRDWTIAQVLSHLGSGAEVNVSNIRAAIHDTERIPKDAYPALWERWDAASPREQVEGFERWHGELVATLEEIPRNRLDELQIVTAMGTLSPADVAGMRLREAAVHAWDIAVVLDDGAIIRKEAIPILVDELPGIMGRAADANAAGALEHGEIDISTSDPERSFVLSLRDPIRLEVGSGSPEAAALALPSEALVRLIYGRLDRDHVDARIRERPPGLLDELRKVFSGF